MTLDVSSNQLTALPLEWSNGFVNASQSSLQGIKLQHNQIKVCVLLCRLSLVSQLHVMLGLSFQ